MNQAFYFFYAYTVLITHPPFLHVPKPNVCGWISMSVSSNVVVQVTELDLQEFRLLLGGDHVITDPSEVEPYNIDWLRNLR